jgi:hypothetical protein
LIDQDAAGGDRVGLYLAIFDDDDEELAGFQVGHYSDFAHFRRTIARHLDPARYPLLLEHSDCDGEWSVADLPDLRQEFAEIAAKFKQLPPEEPASAFERTEYRRSGASSLHDCFHNVDEENLLDALIDLCDVAIESKRPISFQ